jgi:hypothetical protein
MTSSHSFANSANEWGTRPRCRYRLDRGCWACKYEEIEGRTERCLEQSLQSKAMGSSLVPRLGKSGLFSFWPPTVPKWKSLFKSHLGEV